MKKIVIVLIILLLGSRAFAAEDDFDISDGKIIVGGYLYSLSSCQSFGYTISGSQEAYFFANGGPYYTTCGQYSKAIYIYRYTNEYGYRYYQGFGIGETLGSVDRDGDGLDNDYDPCPDSEDKHIDITKTYNACTGEWYKFTVNGDSCDTGITYRNTKYSFADLEDAMDAAKDAGCLVTAFSTSSMSAEEYQRWWEQEKNKAGASGPPAGRVDDTDSEVDGPVDFEWDSSSNSTSSSSNSTSDSSGSTSSNSSESSSGSASSNSTSASGDSGGDSSGFGDDLKDSTDKVVDSIEKLGDDIDIDLKDQTRDLKLALAGTTSAINAGSSRLSGDLGDVETALSGLSSKIGNGTSLAHSDAQEIIKQLKSIEKSSNATSGSSQSLAGNGTTEDYGTPPVIEYSGQNSTVEFYNADAEIKRAEEAKNDLMLSWEKLKNKIQAFLNLSLSGISSLPVWNWNILGNTISIDFNKFASALNTIGLSILLVASIRAFFIVFD